MRRCNHDLTTTEAGQLAGLSATTVGKLCDRGELPSYRVGEVGKDRRIPRAAFVDWLDDNGRLTPALADFLRRCIQGAA